MSFAKLRLRSSFCAWASISSLVLEWGGMFSANASVEGAWALSTGPRTSISAVTWL